MNESLKSIYEKYPKELIAELPQVTFDGRIFVVTTVAEADKAVEYLMTQPILGFDTETRPSFMRGHQHKVALLQVSSQDAAFLFRLNHMKLSDGLIKLLQDKTITKVGLSVHDDLRSLQQNKKFVPGIFIDIQNEIKLLGVQDMSLQKIYANLLGGKISKKQQLSNWEADILSDAQKMYASIDAWACIELYKEIHRLYDTRAFRFIPDMETNELTPC